MTIELGAGQLLDALSNLLTDDPMTYDYGSTMSQCVWCVMYRNNGRTIHANDCEWVAAADLLQRRDKDRHPTITEANERQAP